MLLSSTLRFSGLWLLQHDVYKVMPHAAYMLTVVLMHCK